MDSRKKPFLSEESARIQRVEVYLNDLKERLKQLRDQHETVIKRSVDIIKEIDSVSATIIKKNCGPEVEVNIKKLIQEFENGSIKTASSTQSRESRSILVEKNVVSNILYNFEKLSKSKVLNESLELFKQARDSFQKIDTIVEGIKACDCGMAVQHHSTNANTEMIVTEPPPPPHRGLRSKNIDLKRCGSALSRYASCCSSVGSLCSYQSIEDLGRPTVLKWTENGYDGDNDDSDAMVPKSQAKNITNTTQ